MTLALFAQGHLEYDLVLWIRMRMGLGILGYIFQVAVHAVFWHWRDFQKGRSGDHRPQPSRGGAFPLSHRTSCQGKEHPLHQHCCPVVHVFSKPGFLPPAEGSPYSLTMIIISMGYSQYVPSPWLLSLPLHYPYSP